LPVVLHTAFGLISFRPRTLEPLQCCKWKKLRGETARRINSGRGVNANGVATINPDEGIAGKILPLAGHKGHAIATMVDELSGHSKR